MVNKAVSLEGVSFLSLRMGRATIHNIMKFRSLKYRVFSYALCMDSFGYNNPFVLSYAL